MKKFFPYGNMTIIVLNNTNYLPFFLKCTYCFLKLFIYLFYLFIWLRWVFVAVHELSPVVASGGYILLQCAGFSLQWPLLLRSTGFRRAASVVAARGL